MRILAIFAASYSLAVLVSVYGVQNRFLLYLGFVCVLLSALFLFCMRRIGNWRKAAAVCGLGLVSGFLWTIGYQVLFVEPARTLDETTVYLTAQALEFPKETTYGWSVLARAELPEGGSADALLYLDGQGAEIKPGDIISSVTRCRFADRTSSGEEITYYTSKGVFLRGTAYGTLTIQHPERIPLSLIPVYLAEDLKERILCAFPEGIGTQVLAVVTGHRDGLTQSFTTSLQRTGLSHTAAVSGMHMAFLAGFFTCCLGQYRRRTALLVIPICLLFMLVSGCTPSVVRAAIMIVLLMIAPLVKRERDDVTSLATALLVLLVYNPLSVAHVGLQLSFGAVAGIFLVAEPIRCWLTGLLHIPEPDQRTGKKLLWMVPDYCVNTLSATLGAQVFTVGLSALHFSSISLIAPVSNLLTLWAVALIFGGGLLTGIVGLISPEVASLVARLFTPVVQYTGSITEKIGRLPLAAITLESFPYKLWTFVLFFAILFLLVRHTRLAAVQAAFVCAGTLVISVAFTALEFYMGPAAVTVLDVGQGQSVLLRHGKHLTLVDCGGSGYDDPGDVAANWIQNTGRGTLDLLVLTHFHEDHANGVPQLLERIRVACIAMPEPSEDSELYQKILNQAQMQGVEQVYIREDTVLSLEDGSRLTLLAPLGEEGENERGLTVLATTGVFDVLLTGDMGLEVEQLLLEHTEMPDMELLVAGHHGSKYATSQELLETVDPELVFISVGKNNYYGHPAPELLERLVGREVHRTDLEGTLNVRISRSGVNGDRHKEERICRQNRRQILPDISR